MPASSATFPARLAEALEQVGGLKGIAQAAGLDRSTIYKLLAGDAEPKIGTAERLAQALGVDPRWLAYGSATCPPADGRSQGHRCLTRRGGGGRVRG